MKNNVLTRLFLVLINLVIGITVANAQIITTVAGMDSVGYGGNGGPATAAQLHGPVSVVVDTSGNFYFSDELNNCIRKVSTSGIITTFAGNDTAGYTGNGGPATAAKLNRPGTMGIDATGNIYFADMGNNVIREISPSDTITTVAGSGAYGFSGDGGSAGAAALNKPSIAVDPSGNIYIADQANFRIRKVSSGIISTIAGTGVAGYSGDGGAGATAQISPINIAIDPSTRNIYFVDSVSSVYRVIREITPSGTISTFLNIWGESIAFDGLGNMYFTDVSCYVRRVTLYGTVSIYAGNSQCTSSGDGGPAIAAGMDNPTGLAFDANLNLYVTEYGGERVRKITYAPPTAVNNVAANIEAVSVYPNPASEEFTIEMPSATGKVSIIISDILGKVIETRSVDSNNGIKESFEAKNFVPGTYLIKISSGDKIYREKVLVR